MHPKNLYYFVFTLAGRPGWVFLAAGSDKKPCGTSAWRYTISLRDNDVAPSWVNRQCSATKAVRRCPKLFLEYPAPLLRPAAACAAASAPLN